MRSMDSITILISNLTGLPGFYILIFYLVFLSISFSLLSADLDAIRLDEILRFVKSCVTFS